MTMRKGRGRHRQLCSPGRSFVIRTPGLTLVFAKDFSVCPRGDGEDGEQECSCESHRDVYGCINDEREGWKVVDMRVKGIAAIREATGCCREGKERKATLG